MELLARTRIVMWEGAGLWLIDASPVEGRQRKKTDFHAHHAIQIVIGLGGGFGLRTADRQVTASLAAVAADAPHDFEAEGLLAILFVEPESRSGRAISSKLFRDGALVEVPPELIGDFAQRATADHRLGARNDDELAELGRGLVRRLAGDLAVQQPDYRVRRMITWARGQIEGPVSLSDVVGVAGLSAGRLRHLFVEQVGLPFKTYLLWLRLNRAVEVMATGEPLTRAAHEAGFADSAHFSRTFRRMFGIAPATLRID